MTHKFTALLMFVIAMTNLLGLGGGERAFACMNSSADAISTSIGASDIGSVHVANQESNDCGDCQHQDNSCHQCHLGHCHFLMNSTVTSFVRLDVLMRHNSSDFSLLSIHPSSFDKPPRI